MNRPAEKKFSWVQYKSRLISPIRINNGVSFLQRFLPEFEKAEKEFGVPKEIIAAISVLNQLWFNYWQRKSNRFAVDSCL